MNVNITGIYDLSEDINLLQTNLSSLTADLFDLSQSLPNTYANLTTFSTLSDDYDDYKSFCELIGKDPVYIFDGFYVHRDKILKE